MLASLLDETLFENLFNLQTLILSNNGLASLNENILGRVNNTYELYVFLGGNSLVNHQSYCKKNSKCQVNFSI